MAYVPLSSEYIVSEMFSVLQISKGIGINESTSSNHFIHVQDVTKAELYWLLMSTDWKEDRTELEHSPSLPVSFMKACLPAHIYWETWLPADPGMPRRELAVTISAYWWQICLVLLSVLLFMGRTVFCLPLVLFLWRKDCGRDIMPEFYSLFSISLHLFPHSCVAVCHSHQSKALSSY